MNRFLGRSEKLLMYIQHKAGNVKLSELEEYLEIGKSTLEKELGILKLQITNENILIKDKEVLLNVDSPLIIEQNLFNLYNDNLFFNIIRVLFNKKISLDQLATFFNISKSTTYRKCTIIKKWLKEYDLDLATNPWCEIQGNEINIRNLMHQFYDFYLPRSLEKISFFNQQLFLTDVTRLCKSHGYKLKAQSLRKLIILLIIIHIRSNASRYVMYDVYPTEEYSEHMNIVKKLTDYFPKYIDKKKKKTELLYFAINMFSYIKADTKKTLTIEEIYFSKEKNLRFKMIFEILRDMSKTFYFDFSSDIRLIEELNRYTELYYVDSRLGTNNKLSTLTGYINVYKNTPFYLLVEKVMRNLFKRYNFLPELKEIDVFTLYLIFSASQLRIKSKQIISIAIVGESEFQLNTIMAYLELKFSLNVRIYLFTSDDFNTNVFYQEYDLILSSGNMINEFPLSEVLIVSPILSDADKKNIDCKVNENLNKKMTKYTELIIS